MAKGIDVRSRARYFSRIPLGIDQVLHPFPKERVSVEVVQRRADEDLGISRPAKALIALRTIRGDIEEVAFLAADNIAVEFV